MTRTWPKNNRKNNCELERKVNSAANETCMLISKQWQILYLLYKFKWKNNLKYMKALLINIADSFTMENWTNHVEFFKLCTCQRLWKVFSLEEWLDLDAGLVLRWQRSLGFLDLTTQLLDGTVAAANVFTFLLLVQLYEVVHHSLVKVLTTCSSKNCSLLHPLNSKSVTTFRSEKFKKCQLWSVLPSF